MRPAGKALSARAQGMMQALVFVLVLVAAGHCYGAEGQAVLTLPEGVKIATEDNRIVKMASRERDASYADTLIARSRYLPGVNASLSRTFLAYQPGAIFGAVSVPTAERNSLSYGVDVQQTLFDFGARSSRYGASETALDAARLNIGRVRNLVALDFVIAYFDFLETGRMEAVAQKEVERLVSHFNTAQDLYQEGVITKNDLLQAEVRLSDARQRLLTIQNLKTVNAARINNILSRPLRAEVRAVDVPAEPAAEPDMDKAWELAEKQRIELKTLDHDLKVLEFEEVAKRSEYFPRVFAEGGYTYTQNQFQLHEDNWALILGLNMNIFSGGRTKAEIAKIGYRKERLLEQKKKLVEDIRLDVERGYFDIKSARDRIGVTKGAISQAEENLRINKVRYQEGIGTSTDVLDAITLLTTAETNYYKAEYELRRARAGYMYAMGFDLVAEYK